MGQLEDTQHEKQNWHWRNSMRPVRFFKMDARVLIIYLMMFPFYGEIFTGNLFVIGFLLGNTILFSYLESKGLAFPAAVRSGRAWLVTQKRPAWLSFRKRKLLDYG